MSDMVALVIAIWSAIYSVTHAREYKQGWLDGYAAADNFRRSREYDPTPRSHP